MTRKIITFLSPVVKIMFAAGIIYWLVASERLDFKTIPKILSFSFISIGLFLIGLNLFICSERWRLLCKTQSIEASTWSMFKLSLIGSFFNFAMPGGVGGDLVKGFYFSKEHQNSKLVAYSSIIIDRILGLYALVLLPMLVMIFDFAQIKSNPTLLNLFYFILILNLLLLFALYLLFSKNLFVTKNISKILSFLPFTDKLKSLYFLLHGYGKSTSKIFTVVGLSLIAQFCSIFFLYLAGEKMLGLNISLHSYLFVAPLGFVTMAIPISPAGVGVGQAAFLYLFNLYLGYETQLGPACITSFQIFQFGFGLIGGLFYLIRKEKIPADIEAESNGPVEKGIYTRLYP